MLKDVDVAHGLRSVSFRYFNTARADPEAEIGETHELETHLIPLVLAAARDATAIKVFRNDYDTTDGTCIRDYVHVLDIADAHVRALKSLIDGGASCAVNLPTSEAARYWKSWRRPRALLANRSKSGWCQNGPAIRRSRSALSKERKPCWAGNQSGPNWKVRYATHGHG